MSSSRLPGKHMLPAAGRPMLARLIERLRRVPSLDAIIVATTTAPGDDVLCELALECGVGFHRGSEDDVLARVLGAARGVGGDLLVEITGDCPVIDPGIVEQAIRLHAYNDADYTSNAQVRSYPDGMDVQVFPVDLLAETEGLTSDPNDREHVSLYIRRHPEAYRQLHLVAPPEQHWPELGLTLDESDDYRLLAHLYEHFLPGRPDFDLADIVRYLRSHPELVELNRHVRRNEVPA